MELNKRNDALRERSAALPPDIIPTMPDAGGGVQRPDLRPERTIISKFRFVFRHLWIVGLTVIVGLLLAIGYVMKTVPIYRSTIVLQVAQQQQRSFASAETTASGVDDLRDDAVLNTITESLKLASLYVRVANDPTVQADPHIVPQTGDRPSPYALAGKIKSETSVNLRRGTRLVDISVESPSPDAAQVLATVVVEQFIAASAESDVSSSKTKGKFLIDEVDRTKSNLQKSEDGLEVYKEALRQKGRVDDQQKIIDGLTQRYLEAHPKIVEARSLIADIKRSFDAEIKKVIATSPTEAAYWAQSQSTLTAQTPDDVINAELKMVEARTSVLQHEVDTESSLFANLLRQMREEDVQKESAPVEVKVMDPATLPTHPVRPDPQASSATESSAA